MLKPVLSLCMYRLNLLSPLISFVQKALKNQFYYRLLCLLSYCRSIYFLAYYTPVLFYSSISSDSLASDSQSLENSIFLIIRLVILPLINIYSSILSSLSSYPSSHLPKNISILFLFGFSIVYSLSCSFSSIIVILLLFSIVFCFYYLVAIFFFFRGIYG